ncbi:hypothetical protein CC1G_02048 [Coprinopsis cinerea okayama7|uniref:Rho GTPase-activating protein 39 n=1 Tax=Coprinopsis cinerea (strain Okayama-7 / 130 / ATCC MYA-4618 / FGSC 9003) TaxID=240176 RepID=A8N6E3_COPC7|nr:hypothetical protein CC1G_02048 [Coprinopsis cinerea okayama7\|eukprot:XP_001830412.2 hypothetical protein CC1G_02048 [Coprinopsis cinerea okayama7\
MTLSVKTNVSPSKSNGQPNSATTPISPRNSHFRDSVNPSRPTTAPHNQLSNSRRPQERPRTGGKASSEPEETWGSNFWVTLVDPQTQTSFFACPGTGEVSWDPPVGHFVLPPSTEGEWWELSDESRGGMRYYYHTKTGETVWDRPSGFVIPLGILQNTALARRLSQIDRTSKNFDQDQSKDRLSVQHPPPRGGQRQSIRRSVSDQQHHHNRLQVHPNLSPIPGSPYATEHSAPPSPSSTKFGTARTGDSKDGSGSASKAGKDSPSRKSNRGDNAGDVSDGSIRKSKSSSSYSPVRAQQPQSLHAALEKLNVSQSEGPHSPSPSAKGFLSESTRSYDHDSTPSHSPPASVRTRSRDIPPSPSRSVPPTPSGPTVGGKNISKPVLNHAATLQMSPVKNRETMKPIAVVPKIHVADASASKTTLNAGSYPVLPDDLVSDIQLFSESEYAKQYFSTHKSGFIFKRKIPVEQLMTWQKSPLASPLLLLNRTLHKDAVKIFKGIQFIMGDRERERPSGLRLQPDTPNPGSINASSTSLVNPSAPVLEQQRWILGEGLLHGELRDEIYCQLMKQLTGNPSTESIFKGWQFLCVLLLTFPPSKNFETYLESFITKHTTYQEGRIDVIAKYCLRRLSSISMKGPRGKPPSIQEIETAADAAFNPSTFGESLDAIIRLQERNYPHQKVPIILPFLADGILALGGPRAEGIFRVPGDSDSVSELKLRIDRGYYTLESVDDPHVLASLMKLWLRELCDPLVPSEMYNECIMSAQDPHACVQIVYRLPTINRRVILFVISFLQLFLEEKTQSITKMTPANLALVMAPNLLRCTSDSMSVVFTNAQYEQIFIYHLLLHLKCDEVDPDYRPTHGLGAAKGSSKPGKSHSRRPNS